MPTKNVLKEFVSETYYHIYNRAINDEVLFKTDKDYKVFLSYLKLYLTKNEKDKTRFSRKLNNFSNSLSLLAYCLMPNHFHLFVYQKEVDTITNFMRSLGTKFSLYFNKKNKRRGPVFESRYKAVRVTNEIQFLYLSKYIHRNPYPSRTDLDGLKRYKYSSYPNYLGLFNQNWVKPREILSYFSQTNFSNSYQEFVEETDETDILRIKDVHLDYDL